jgi:hypothetical protein
MLAPNEWPGYLPPSPLAAALRHVLQRLADREDDLASTEAARVPYWSPCPASVIGRREAARALREDAERLLHPVAQLSLAETAFAG